MLFFNSSDEVKALLSIPGHVPKQSGMLYWIMCRQHKSKWRGHWSSFYCPIYNFHLCISTYPGLKKSCWGLWYSSKVPKLIKPPGLVGSSSSENKSDANNEGAGKQAVAKNYVSHSAMEDRRGVHGSKTNFETIGRKTAIQTSSHDYTILSKAAHVGPTRRQRRE